MPPTRIKMGKGRFAVIVIWCVMVLVTYLFFIPKPPLLSLDYGASSSKRLVDAIVLIAMGKMAEDSMIDFSIASIRKIGNWKRDIYVLTDRKGCFADAAAAYNLKLIEMEPVTSIIEIKALKPKLLKYLPETVSSVLYLDVDILGEIYSFPHYSYPMVNS